MSKSRNENKRSLREVWREASKKVEQIMEIEKKAISESSATMNEEIRRIHKDTAKTIEEAQRKAEKMRGLNTSTAKNADRFLAEEKEIARQEAQKNIAVAQIDHCWIEEFHAGRVEAIKSARRKAFTRAVLNRVSDSARKFMDMLTPEEPPTFSQS
jgi:predicted phage tail protein